MTMAPTRYAGYGPIINDLSGQATTFRQIGGTGVALWKQLAYGAHLQGAWNTVEHVTLLPGAGVGEHVHDRTEEIYYILAGEAVVRMNGEEHRVRAGDLVTTPIGARHAIRNDAGQDMAFFVVEVFPGAGPARPPALFTVADRPSPVDLTEFFTGPWKTFLEVTLAPGEGVDEHTRPGSAVVLLVVDGEAAITVDGETYLGGPGLCVGLPDSAARAVHNPSADRPLRLIATEVGLT